MNFETKIQDDVMILQIRETRIDMTNAIAFRQEIMRQIDDGHQRIVVDLSQAEFMDSSALGVLIAAVKRAGLRGSLAVVGVQGAVSRLVTLTGLDRVLDLHRTTDLALQHMAA